MSSQENQSLRRSGSKFYYGYIIVIVAFFTLLISFGSNNSFGIFFKPMLNELNWSRAVTSGSFSVSMLVYGLVSFAAGGLSDRFGPRLVVMSSGIFLGLGYILMSQVSSVWQLYLFYGVLIGIGMSGFWVPQMSAVARWFTGRRTLMTGFIVAGTGVGGLALPPVVNWLIAVFDWRWSLAILGGFSLLVIVISSQFLRHDTSRAGQESQNEKQDKRRDPAASVQGLTLQEAVRSIQFWLVILMFFCLGYCFVTIMVHIVPHITDLAFSPADGALILAIIGGIGIPGNLLLGGAADRIGNRWIFILSFIVLAVILFWLVVISELWMLYVFAVIFGFFTGGCGACESPIVARLFGLRFHGLIYGIAHFGFAAGAASGPFLSGYLFDTTGSYQTAFIICAAVGVAGFILAAALRPTRKLGGRV